jgi:hypothetical protein
LSTEPEGALLKQDEGREKKRQQQYPEGAK